MEAKKTVHHILAHSYSVFFIGLILGLLLDLIYPIRIIPKEIGRPAGLALIILAPALIFWAQYTSNKLRARGEKLIDADFRKGPYRLSRNPTHLGISALVAGFGLLSNSIFVVVLTLISFVVSRFVFVKEQEEILAKNYGEAYAEYKKSVRG